VQVNPGAGASPDRGRNPTTLAFTRDYGTEVLGSSLLTVASQGFVAPSDPMWISALEAMEAAIAADATTADVPA
jgi:GH15 family glucan-1,4-alpha-glucosidase